MDIVSAAVSHLKLSVPALATKVAGVTELEAAIANTNFIAPHAYVLMLGEQAQPNTLVSGISQKVVLTFGVVLAVPNGLLSSIGSQSPQNILQEYRNPAINAMLGWEPDADHDPATFVRGRLVQVQGKVLWWQDEFETAFYRRKV